VGTQHPGDAGFITTVMYFNIFFWFFAGNNKSVYITFLFAWGRGDGGLPPI